MLPALLQGPRRRAFHIFGEMTKDLIVPAAEGLYWLRGKFHIDPWRPAALAVITQNPSLRNSSCKPPHETNWDLPDARVPRKVEPS